MREPKIKGEMVGEYWAIPIFECDWCGDDMGEWVEHGDEFICLDCAFKHGLISSEEYVQREVPDVFKDHAKATIYNGEIYIKLTEKGKYEFEKNNRDYRRTVQYKNWRSKVFERDGFKCQECGQIGGNLNAHHIKPFKDYPKLRFDVGNGITLCEKCHRELHKRLRANDRKR